MQWCARQCVCEWLCAHKNVRERACVSWTPYENVRETCHFVNPWRALRRLRVELDRVIVRSARENIGDRVPDDGLHVLRGRDWG
eukprot:2151249-Pleurochrysis_carterae.AAC.1